MNFFKNMIGSNNNEEQQIQEQKRQMEQKIQQEQKAAQQKKQNQQLQQQQQQKPQEGKSKLFSGMAVKKKPIDSMFLNESQLNQSQIVQNISQIIQDSANQSVILHDNSNENQADKYLNQSQDQSQVLEQTENEKKPRSKFGFLKKKEGNQKQEPELPKQEEPSYQLDEEQQSKPKKSKFGFMKKDQSVNKSDMNNNSSNQDDVSKVNEENGISPDLNYLNFNENSQKENNNSIENISISRISNKSSQKEEKDNDNSLLDDDKILKDQEIIEEEESQDKQQDNQQIKNNENTQELGNEEISQKDFDKLNKRLNENEDQIKNDLNKIVSEQHNLMNKKNYLEIEKDKLKKTIKNIEQQQNEAVSQENYEIADQLEMMLKEHLETINQTEMEILMNMQVYNELERQKQSLFIKEAQNYNSWVQEYKLLLEKKDSQINTQKQVYQHLLNTEKVFIEEENERLKINKNHIDLDLKHIEEENQQVDECMDKQTKEFTLEQKKKIEKQNQLETEIENIHSLLKSKQNELSKIKNELEFTVNKINSVRSKFDSQLQKLQYKRSKIQEELQVYMKEEQNLSDAIQQNQNNQQKYQHYIENSNKNFNLFNQQYNSAKDEEKQIEKQNQKRKSIMEKFDKSNSEFIQEQLLLKDDKEQLEKLEQQVLQKEKNVAMLQEQKVELSQKIPVLENEKKENVNQRNFKNASVLNAQIKQLQQDSDEKEQQILNINNEILAINDSIDKIQNRMKDSDDNYKQLKKVADLDRFNLLQINYLDLKQLYQFSLNKRYYEECNILENEIKYIEKESKNLEYMYPDELSKELILQKSQQHNEQVEEQTENIYQSEKNDLIDLNQQENNQYSEQIDQNIEYNHNFQDIIQQDIQILEKNQEELQEQVLIENSLQMNESKEMYLLRLQQMIQNYKENEDKFKQYETEIDIAAGDENFELAEELNQQSEILKEQNNQIQLTFERDYGVVNLEEAINYLNENSQ